MLVAMSAVASAPASPGRPAHLVLAVAWGYQPEVYKVFLSSLRNTGYRGDIKILAPEGGTLPAAAEVCARHGAEIVGLFNMTLHPTGHPKAGKPAWMSGERFNMYDALCGGGGYEWCLAADFRDVFFQSNPFANLPQHSGSFHEVERPHANRKKGGVQQAPTPELLLPLESRVIGTCPHNSYMMRRCFGKPAVAAIGANPVICSGVIMGTPAAYAVLRRIATLVRRCPFDKMSDQV